MRIPAIFRQEIINMQIYFVLDEKKNVSSVVENNNSMFYLTFDKVVYILWHNRGKI